VDQKIYDFLGLAQRAGQVCSGDAAAEAAIKNDRAKLLLVAADASHKTKEHFINLAKFKKIPWLEYGEKMPMGAAIGKSPRSVAVITEENFARKLQQLIKRERLAF